MYEVMVVMKLLNSFIEKEKIKEKKEGKKRKKQGVEESRKLNGDNKQKIVTCIR